MPFDGSKIQITCVRVADYWGGNAVHFRYDGRTYRASIREDPDSEDESGNRINYAHLQIADKNGNWGDDIATEDGVDVIPVSRYGQSTPYKFYDTALFAESLNDLFVQ